jgi:hypothetical protein
MFTWHASNISERIPKKLIILIALKKNTQVSVDGGRWRSSVLLHFLNFVNVLTT